MLKKLWPDVLAAILFAVISFGYFLNPTLDGLVLTGHDHGAAVSCNVETDAYLEKTGERSRWNNSLFSGMPTYQMSPSYGSTDTLFQAQKAFKFWMPTYAGYLMFMLIGFYIMMRCFGFNQWKSAMGAVLWALSSYYPIIIGAGHIWKLLTLAFIPPTIGGIWLCYKGKYLMGGLMTALFLALQILNNHVQMTYYFIIVIAAVAIACLIDAIRHKELKQWFMASGVCVVAAILAVCINLSNLYHTYEYSKETMRGKSELTQMVKSSDNQTKDGLDRDYITAWSYGIDETWTLFVPNAKGGASSHPMSQSETAMKKAQMRYKSIYNQVGQYWGDQPGTSGPVYVGALVMLLFVLGLMIVKGPLKWALFVATVLSIMLSWGKNLMWFTNLWLDYVPMYDKFRTVASILVVAEFTIPLLAMLGLRELVKHRDDLGEKISVLGVKMSYKACFYTSVGITAGAALLMVVMPEALVGNFLSLQESGMFGQMVQKGELPADLVSNLQDMRRAMVTGDALRSLLVVLAGAAVMLCFALKKINAKVMTGALLVICLIDLWQVDKRYLNDEMFSRPKAKKEYFKATEADNYILRDKEHHRVLDFSHSTFNDNTAGYYHHSIGGYHAAKLRRYQELIENHISTEMAGMQSMLTINDDSISYKVDFTKGELPVLNMLDMKYMILPAQDGHTIPAVNPGACGNAWFVSTLSYVNGADAELASLYNMDTQTEAVADKKFEKVLGNATDPGASTIKLTEYECNELKYEATSERGGVVVFSEIYYPGWQVSIDGKPAELGRVNYVLRALQVPAGTHTIQMCFKPQSLTITERIAYVSLLLMVAGLVLLLYRCAKHKPQVDAQSAE